MLSRNANRMSPAAIAKVKPAVLMRASRLPFLVKVYPFKPSCLTSSSMRAGPCASRDGRLGLLVFTQDRVGLDQS